MSTLAVAADLPPIEDYDDKAFDPFALESASFGDEPDPWSRLTRLRQRLATQVKEDADGL